jgi:ribonuclease D
MDDYPQELEKNLSVFHYVSGEASLNALVAQVSNKGAVLVLDTSLCVHVMR